MCGRIDTWPKMLHQPINPSTNTRKIVKLYADVCGYGYGCVNVNVVDSVSVNSNENVVGYVREKIFLYLLTKPNGYAIIASQNKNARPLGKLNFVFELMRTIPIFQFRF